MNLFGTAGIRGPVGETVTPELALQVGRAVGRPERTVYVGRDGRTSGSALAAAASAGLQAAGATVVRVGVVPTPTLAWAARDEVGLMLTASHNPPADNGIKLFEAGVEFDRASEQAVAEAVASDPEPVTWSEWGRERREAVLVDYRDAVVETLEDRYGDQPLEGLAVAVDCGGGVGALATPQVLTTLGADVEAINATVDGHSTARDSKPTPDSVRPFRQFVETGAFDLGIAHDGDADRLVVVAPDGSIRHEDTVLAAVARAAVDGSSVDEPVVVTTPNASGRIDEAVARAGGRVERVRLGALHEGVAAVSDGRVVFAAEPWKHMHPAFGGWIDGVIAAGHVSCLVARAGGLDSLCAGITERPYRKVSVDCPDDRKAETMARLEARLPAQFPDAAVSTEYGLRLTFEEGGWTLVRPSGTEPYLRIYAEAEAVDALVETVREAVTAALEGDPRSRN